MKVLSIFAFLLVSLSSFSVEKEKNLEIGFPNTIDISDEVIEIDQSYVRDLASEEETEQTIKPTLEFWSFE